MQAKRRKVGSSVFYRGTNVPAVQAFENRINLEKQKQEQDTDMNVIDTDCSGSRADASSYFCSGGHRRTFLVFSFPFFFQTSIISCV